MRACVIPEVPCLAIHPSTPIRKPEVAIMTKISNTTKAPTVEAGDSARRSALRKVNIRLMPFIFLLYLVNYIDRTALGIAAPNGMNDELQLTATLFGLASGIFFVGYILLEVPSVMAAQKSGARVWIARIAVSWGLVASLTAFVPSYEWLSSRASFSAWPRPGSLPGAAVSHHLVLQSRTPQSFRDLPARDPDLVGHRRTGGQLADQCR